VVCSLSVACVLPNPVACLAEMLLT